MTEEPEAPPPAPVEAILPPGPSDAAAGPLESDLPLAVPVAETPEAVAAGPAAGPPEPGTASAERLAEAPPETEANPPDVILLPAPTPEADGTVEPGAAAEAPPPVPAARRRFPYGTVAAILVLLVVGIAAAVTYPRWRPWLAPGGPAAEQAQAPEAAPPGAAEAPATAPTGSVAADALAERVDRLSKSLDDTQRVLAELPSQEAVAGLTATTSDLGHRVEALEARPAGSAEPPPALKDLPAEVAQLGQRVEALEQRPAGDPAAAQQARDLAGQVAQLATRVAALESGVKTAQSQAVGSRALVLAAGQLDQALATGGSIAPATAVIRSLAGEDAALAQPLAVLERHAEAGVPSRWMLTRDLAAIPAKLAAPETPPPDADLWERVKARLSGLVSVHPVEEPTRPLPAGPEKDVADARAALAGGDLAAAVAAISDLKGDDAARAQPWLDAARGRLETEQAAAAVEAAADAALARQDGATP